LDTLDEYFRFLYHGTNIPQYNKSRRLFLPSAS
jgi:hypothetical protein